MRKLKLQMQISVDGFVCGPNGEMDWMTWNWNPALEEYVTALTAPVDCILMGRKLAEGFIPHWTAHVANPETADDFGRKMVDTHKVVFSKSLQEITWDSTSLESGDLVAAVNALKALPGGDIITYGGARFAASLISAGLIDELHLFVNPAAIGSGMPIFAGRTSLKLAHATAFDCGIVVHCYHPA
jgi:dihydrofolate reductase